MQFSLHTTFSPWKIHTEVNCQIEVTLDLFTFPRNKVGSGRYPDLHLEVFKTFRNHAVRYFTYDNNNNFITVSIFLDFTNKN